MWDGYYCVGWMLLGGWILLGGLEILGLILLNELDIIGLYCYVGWILLVDYYH